MLHMRLTMNICGQHSSHLALSRMIITMHTSAIKSKWLFTPYLALLTSDVTSYYSAYLEFFKSELLKKGLAECLEEYVLSSAANFDGDSDHLAMLSRFMNGVIHPFIHVGYGTEFGLLGFSAEGISALWTCSRRADQLRG